MTNAELIQMIMTTAAEQLKTARTEDEKLNILVAQNNAILAIISR